MKPKKCAYCDEPIEKDEAAIKDPDTGGQWMHTHCNDEVRENLGGIDVEEIMERDFYYRHSEE